MRLTCVVLSKNCEKEISRCLNSLNFCKDIIVIDDFSSDNTVKIAKEMNAKVFKRDLNDDFSEQRNFGLEKAKTEWVLFLDSDEEVSDNLRDEILSEIRRKDNKKNGYFIKRDDFFLGKQLKFGETSNVKLLRLGRKNMGKWKRKVHETWQIKGQVGLLKNHLIHFPHKTLGKFIKSINFYTDLDSRSKIDENKNSSVLKIIFFPIFKFLRNFIYLFGFLDGTHGFIISVMMSFHSYLSWSKLWLYRRK